MLKRIIGLYLTASAIGWCFYALLYLTLGALFSPYPMLEITMRVASMFLANTVVAAVGLLILGVGHLVGVVRDKASETQQE